MKHKRVYPDLRTFLEDFARRGGKQAEFAAKMGMSNGYLSDIKNGRVRPSLALAAKLAREAGVPIESFLVDSPVSQIAS
jgi:transcriptional regulator with XRE-family HTH domain